MKIGRLVLVAVMFLLVVSAVPDVKACSQAYSFSQWNNFTYVYNYTNIPAGTFGLRFWQPGNRAAVNEGTNTNWFFPYGANWYIDGFMAGGEVGCSPDGGQYIHLVQSNAGTTSWFAAGRVAGNYANPVIWDYSNVDCCLWNAVEVAYPKISVTGKTGNVLTMNVNFTDLTAGGHGGTIVTGYRLLEKAQAADPGRVPTTNWVFKQRVPTGGNITGMTFDCTGITTPVWYGVQVEFDNGQFNGDFVGKATAVNCDPTQANPRYKIIDKKTR